MAKPNSLTTLIRRVLVSLIDPHPDPGEGWCLECSLNDGRTLIIPFDAMGVHLEQHPAGEAVNIRGWRSVPEPGRRE